MSATDRNDQRSKPPAVEEHDSFRVLDQCFKEIRSEFKALQEQCEDLRIQRDQYWEEISKQVNELTMIRATVSTLGTLQEDTRAARDRLKEENLRLVVELGKFNCLPQAPGLARDRDHDGHTKRHGIDRERNVSERCDIDGDIVMANSSTAGAIGSEPLEPHTRSVSGSPLRTPSDHFGSESSHGPYHSSNGALGRGHDREENSSWQALGPKCNSAIPAPPTRSPNGRLTTSPLRMVPSFAISNSKASQKPDVLSGSPPSPASLPPPHQLHPRSIALSPAPLGGPPVHEGTGRVMATSTSAENSKVSVISPRSAASPTSLSPPVAPFAPQIDLYVDPQEVVPKYKKEGPDWFVIFNPEASGPQRPDNQLTKSLDVQLVHSLAHLSVVCCVRFSLDDKYLATGCKGEARLYEVDSGQQVCVLAHRPSAETQNPGHYVRSLCFSPDGKYLATGGEDASVMVWDIHAQQVKAILKGHRQAVYGLDYSRDGQIIVSGSGDQTVRIWETRDMTGSPCRVFRASERDDIDAGVTSVCISPDSRLVAASSLDRVVCIWDIQTGELIKNLEGHMDAVYSIAFTPNGNGVVSGSLDQTLKHWDIRPALHARAMAGLAGKPDRGAKDGCDGGRKGIWDARKFTGHKDYVLTTAVSSDGRFIVSGSKDRSVQLWDANTAIPQFMLQGHTNSVISVAINGAGDLLATGTGDCRARIWKFQAV